MKSLKNFANEHLNEARVNREWPVKTTFKLRGVVWSLDSYYDDKFVNVSKGTSAGRSVMKSIEFIKNNAESINTPQRKAPVRTMTDRQFEKYLKDAMSDLGETSDHGHIHDTAASMIHDVAIRNYMELWAKKNYHNFRTEFDKVSWLADQMANYAI